MYESDETDFPAYFATPKDDKPKDEEKPKADPFKYEKMAGGYIEDRAARGEYPLYYNGKLYHYTGTHYAVEPEPDHAVREWMKRAKKGQSNNVVGNVRPVIESYCRKPVTKYPAMPFYCGNDPFPEPRNVIAYTNGLMDVAAGGVKLIPHTPKWCSSTCLPFEYDPTAGCPSWLQFLNEVFDGDGGRIDLLQEWFGYCLTVDTSLQKAMVQVGKARSGKGTTQRVLQALIGRDNWTAYTLPQLATEFGMSPLDGKQAAFVGEVELSGHPMKNVILERLKGIIGEDPVSINEKYEKPRSVKLTTRFMVSCNEMPTFYDASGAIGQRFLYLHYQKSFAGREDRGLEDRLKTELPGINNWALAGLARLRENGGRFTVPETSRTLAADFSMRSNPIHAFVRDCLVVHRRCDPGDIPDVELTDKPEVTVTKDAVYKMYQNWCEDHEVEPKDMRWFGRDLANAIPKVQESRPKVNGGRVRVYLGIGPKAVQKGTEDGMKAAPNTTPPPTVFGPTPEVQPRPAGGVADHHVRVPWMPADMPGTVVAHFPEAGTVRVQFLIGPDRFAALDEDQKSRLRPSGPNVYFVDEPAGGGA